MMNTIYNKVKRVAALALAVTMLAPATQAQEAMHLFYKNGKHEIIEMTPDTKVEFYKKPYMEETYYTAGGDTIYVPASSGRTMNFGNVVANVPWTIAIDADWMMARRSSKLESWYYLGDGMIEEPFLLFVESNKTGELRTAKVTISTAFGVAKEFVVAQHPFMLSLERLGDHYGLEPTLASENIMEWTDTILEVPVYPDFDVKVASHPDWMTLDTLWYYSDWFSLEKVAQVPDSIRVTGEGFGSGYSYARFRFAQNESQEDRTGNIIFEGNGQTAVLTVTQKGLHEETIVGYATNLAKKLYEFGAGGMSSRHSDLGYPSLMLAMESRGTDLVSEKSGYNWFSNQMGYGDLQSNYYFTSMHWNAMYYVIMAANKAWQDFGERSNESLFQFYLAQASALRAFNYFYLAQLYQQTYVGNEDQPCVPIVSGAYKYIVEKEQCPRATVREVYDYILRDLDMAEHLLSETTVTNVGKHLVTRQVINGLRARIYMVMNEWAKAAEYAQRVIDSGMAKPYTMDEVSRPTFSDINHSAWLWGIDTEETDNVVLSGYCNWPSHMGSFSYGYAQLGTWRKVSQSLYNAIPSTDVRKGWFLGANRASGNLNDEQRSYVAQYGMPAYTQVKFAPYKDELGTNINASDIPLMRIEEMYLILAEAQAMLGNTAEAAKTLNSFVTTYRDPAYNCTAATAEEMQNAVWMQRRIELWGEGHSYFDLMRMKKGVDRRGAGFSAEYVYNIPAGDAALIYPIPASEMNSNMNLIQNPEAEIPVAVEEEIESHSYKLYSSGVFISELFGSYYQDMEVATDDNTVYRLPGYIAEGYDLNFIWDAEKGVVEVARTTWQSGYVHPTYGMVSATCQSVGYNAETKTFTFVIEYTCSAGSFGTYNETYTISDVYSATARRAQQATQKEIKPITLELK